MDTKHWKWILVLKKNISALPSLPYYSQSQICTISGL